MKELIKKLCEDEPKDGINGLESMTQKIDEINVVFFQRDTRGFLENLLKFTHETQKEKTNIIDKTNVFCTVLEMCFSPAICGTCKEDGEKRNELLAFTKIILEKLENELRNSITPKENKE